MKYVLDSCVAIKWVLNEHDSARALQIRDDFARGVHELLAPDVFPVEVAHALSRAERKGILLPPQGAQGLASLLNALPDLHPYLPLLPRAFEVSSATRISVYDCLYVALAEREGCELLTADTRLVNALSKDFPFLLALDSLP
jgi:predicted nucleic acid-binding protein